MADKTLINDPNDDSARALGNPRTCPECGRAIQEPPVSSTQLTVLQKGMVVEKGGRVIGQVIKKLVERPLTPEEEKDLARGLELRYLQEGVIACAQGIERGWKAKDARKGNPYKGLVAYGLSDAEFFFGRDLAITELLDRIQNDRLTVLHAESGAGKTSLLQAGIAPQLLASQHLPVRIRALDENPTVAVKKAFLRDLDSAVRLAKVPLRDFLHYVDTMLGPEMGLFIFLDQFEEFFTLLEPPEERDKFIRALAECLSDESLSVRWVIALRGERFSDLSKFVRYIDLSRNHYRLDRLTREEAREVVAGPAALRGVQFAPELMSELLAELDKEGIGPPQLQLVCSALWEKRKPEESVIARMPPGGVRGILDGYLSAVLEQHIPRELREQAPRVLEALISPQKQINRRARRTRSDLTNMLGIEQEALDRILEQLVARRLLQSHDPGREGTETVYELVHDHLVEIIQLDPSVQARNLAQEMLDSAVDSWQHDVPATRERLEKIAPHRDRLTLAGAEDVLIHSALNEAHDIAGWLEVLGERQQDIELVRDALVGEDEEKRRLARQGLEGCQELPVGLREALEFEFEKGAKTRRWKAAEALWPWRRQLGRTLRLRLYWKRASRQARVFIKRRWLALSLAMLVVAVVAVFVVPEIDRRERASLLAREIDRRRDEFSAGTWPRSLFLVRGKIWVATRGWLLDEYNAKEVLPLTQIDLATGEWKSIYTSEDFVATDFARGGENEVWVGFEPIECSYSNACRRGDGQSFVTKFVYIEGRGWARPKTKSIWVDQPDSLLFDGTDLWVADEESNSIMKLDVGADPITVAMTIPISNPLDLAFDGTHLWVASRRNVARLRAEDGEIMGFFEVGEWVNALAVEGRYVWAATDDGTIVKLDRDTGRKISTYRVGECLADLIVTPVGIFASDYCRSTVVQLNPDLGREVATFEVETPIGLVFDGANLWVASAGERSVVRLPVTTVPLSIKPLDILFDGTYVWTTDGADMVRVHAANGWLTTAEHYYSSASNPTAGPPVALAFDGTHVRVADTNRWNVWGPALPFEGFSRLFDYIPQLWYFDPLWTSFDLSPPGSETTASIGDAAQMVFDGEYLWVGNGSPQFSEGAWVSIVMRVDPEEERVVDTFPFETKTVAMTLDNDAGRVWVFSPDQETLTSISVDDFSTEIYPAEVPEWGASNVSFGERTPYWEEDWMTAMTYGGGSVWVACEQESVIVGYDADTGEQVSEFPVKTYLGGGQVVPCGPTAIEYAQESVWVTCPENNTAQRYQRDGQLLQVIAVGDGPAGLVFDGTSLWVANVQDRSLTRIYVDD